MPAFTYQLELDCEIEFAYTRSGRPAEVGLQSIAGIEIALAPSDVAKVLHECELLAAVRRKGAEIDAVLKRQDLITELTNKLLAHTFFELSDKMRERIEDIAESEYEPDTDDDRREED